MLKVGDKGYNVRRLQRMLLRLGYDLPKYGIDGDYGDETSTAVEAFKQHIHQMITQEIDNKGIVSQELLALTEAIYDRAIGWTSFQGGCSWRINDRGEIEIYGESIIFSAEDLQLVASIKDRFHSLIKLEGAKQNVDEALITATICTESGGNSTVYRYEPNFYKRYIEDKPKWISNPYYNEPERISASYGLMQIMYSTAYGLGFREEPEELYNVATNIYWGTYLLSKQSDITQLDPVKVAACYNAGGLYYSKDNKWHLKSYSNHIDRFVRFYNCVVNTWL